MIHERHVKEKLILYLYDLQLIISYFGANYYVNYDLNSHTDGIVTYGMGVPISQSMGKINTRGSSKNELAFADGISTMIL